MHGAALGGERVEDILLGDDDALALLEGQQAGGAGRVCEHGYVLCRRLRAVALQQLCAFVLALTCIPVLGRDYELLGY